jgi:hypothetical protein
MAGSRLKGVSKDLKPLIEEARRSGWEIFKRNNGHLKFVGPDGEKVFCSHTPSDHRAIKNIKKDLSNAGLDLE